MIPTYPNHVSSVDTPPSSVGTWPAWKTPWISLGCHYPASPEPLALAFCELEWYCTYWVAE